MGRWAQRRQRSSASDSPAPPPPSPVAIVSVVGNGTSWSVNFDGPITQDVGNDDAAFFVGDATTTHCNVCAGSTADCSDDGTAGYVPGLAWSLVSQPAWLLTPIAGPQSGTTI
jgi:hypothetical protein